MPYAGMLYFMPLDPIHCIISKVEVLTGEEMGNISSSVDSGSSLSSMGTNLMLLAKISMCITFVTYNGHLTGRYLPFTGLLNAVVQDYELVSFV